MQTFRGTKRRIQIPWLRIRWEKETGQLTIADESFTLPCAADLNEELDRDLVEVSCNGDTVCYYKKAEPGTEPKIVLERDVTIEAGILWNAVSFSRFF